MEPRIKVAVMVSGGSFEKVPREVDSWNCAPRVKVPVLMVNGRDDFRFPLESSQIPLFRALGTPEKDKKHVLYDGGHVAIVVHPEIMKGDSGLAGPLSRPGEIVAVNAQVRSAAPTARALPDAEAFRGNAAFPMLQLNVGFAGDWLALLAAIQECAWPVAALLVSRFSHEFLSWATRKRCHVRRGSAPRDRAVSDRAGGPAVRAVHTESKFVPVLASIGLCYAPLSGLSAIRTLGMENGVPGRVGLSFIGAVLTASAVFGPRSIYTKPV
jgi:hypothetical protein